MPHVEIKCFSGRTDEQKRLWTLSASSKKQNRFSGLCFRQIDKNEFCFLPLTLSKGSRTFVSAHCFLSKASPAFVCAH